MLMYVIHCQKHTQHPALSRTKAPLNDFPPEQELMDGYCISVKNGSCLTCIPAPLVSLHRISETFNQAEMLLYVFLLFYFFAIHSPTQKPSEWLRDVFSY